MHAADIASFYRAWYHPNNVTLIISGDIDARQVLVQIHQLYGGMPSVALPRRPASALPVLAAATLRDSFEFPIGLCGLLYRSPGANDADYGASLIALQVLNSGRGALADLSANGKLLAAFDVGTALSDSGATFVVGIPPLTGSPDGAADLLSEALAGYRTAGLPRDLIASAKLKLLSALAYKQASISGIAFDWAQAAAQRLSSLYTVQEGMQTSPRPILIASSTRTIRRGIKSLRYSNRLHSKQCRRSVRRASKRTSATHRLRASRCRTGRHLYSRRTV